MKTRQIEAIKHTKATPIDPRRRTGKTTTITSKIAYKVEKENIDSSPRILEFTFSKEAARIMCEKVDKLFQGKEVIFKTFHSFCAELIRDQMQTSRQHQPYSRLPFLFANLPFILARIWVSISIVAYPDDHCIGDARENVKPMAFTPRAEFVYHVGIYSIKRRLG